MTDHEIIERLLGRPHAWAIAPLQGGSLAAGRIVAAMAGTQALWSCCRQLHAEGRAPHAFRALFSAVWVLDHPRIRADVGRDTLADMMAFGRFVHPPGNDITVWRGGHGVPVEALAAGWSWSTTYRWASWFAMARRPGEQDGAPVVVAAKVPAAGCWSIPDRTAELAGEVLLAESPESVRIAGNPAEWEAEATRAEIVRQVSRPLGAIDDAAEALRFVFAPQKSAGGDAV